MGLFLTLAVPALALSDRPDLAIPIPNLTFSSAQVAGELSDGTPAKANIGIPWIGEYVQAVYKYLTVMAVFLAGIMAVVGGFQYVTAGGDAGKVGKAKERIVDAIVGMVITLSAFVLLYSVNPALVQTQKINVQRVPPDYAYFDQHGTGDPVTDAEAIDKTVNTPIPGTSDGVKLDPGSPGGTTPPTGGSTPPPTDGSSPPPPPPTPTPGTSGPPPGGPDIVDVSDIKWDEDLGGTGNLNKYCTSKAKAAQATTYDQKIQLLTKAVLGFINVCITHRACAYAQGGWTVLPNGPASGRTLPGFAIPKLAANGHPPEEVFASHQDCLDRYNKKGIYASDSDSKFAKMSPTLLMNSSDECVSAVNDSFNATYMKAVNDGHFFAGDCGTTARAILSCSGVKWDDVPHEKAYFPNGKEIKGGTVYLTSKSIATNADNPRMIIAAFMKENMDSEAQKKGGMKFGDLVYTCCGGAPGDYAAHWMMYIGGRPEIPYNFIEMGGSPPRTPQEGKGGGVNVPGWGSTGGVDVKGKIVTLESMIRSRVTPGPPTWCKQGTKGCPATVPAKTDPNAGLVFVWRPFSGSEDSGTTPPTQ